MARLVALACILMLALTACSSNEPNDTASVQGQGSLTFTDMWTKATDTQMTGSFGTITNDSDTDIHITSVTSDVAGMSQIHETVEKDGKMVMQEMADGFVIEAGTDYVLEPGGNHVMLMDLSEELVPGDIITITLVTEDGESIEFTSDVRSYTGAKEEYGIHGEDNTEDHGHGNDETHGEHGTEDR